MICRRSLKAHSVLYPTFNLCFTITTVVCIGLLPMSGNATVWLEEIKVESTQHRADRDRGKKRELEMRKVREPSTMPTCVRSGWGLWVQVAICFWWPGNRQQAAGNGQHVAGKMGQLVVHCFWPPLGCAACHVAPACARFIKKKEKKNISTSCTMVAHVQLTWFLLASFDVFRCCCCCYSCCCNMHKYVNAFMQILRVRGSERQGKLTAHWDKPITGRDDERES